MNLKKNYNENIHRNFLFEFTQTDETPILVILYSTV